MKKRMNRGTGVIALLLCLLLALSACSGADSGADAAPAPPEETPAPTSAAIQQLLSPTGALFETEDLDVGYDAATATSIVLSGTTAAVTGEGVKVEDGLVTITQAGTYLLSGAFTGQVLVDAGGDDLVRLVLDSVSLTHSGSSPLHMKKAGKTVLILPEGTSSTVSDTETYTFPDGEDEPNAAIFADDDLSILGSGSLTVNGNYYNAIGTKDILRIAGGSFTLTAVNDGLRGRDGVYIQGGTFDIQAGNDGVKANNDTDAEKGIIHISGGGFTIQAEHDGIQAETALTITDGAFSITTGGGAAAAPAKVSEKLGGGRNGWNRQQQSTAAPDVTAEPTPEPTPAVEDTESTSKKALKAGTSLTISGGVFSIDAEDDAVHANGDLSVAGGIFEIKTGDDGFHADSALVVDAGEITILQCYEGLEGATVDINGGELTVTASDDGINAAGGSDDNEGFMGRDRFTANSSYYIRITGGRIEIDCGTDGLDSNGSLTISGGELYVHGSPTSLGGDGALDSDGAMEITGGIVIGTSVSDMGGTPGNTSTQPTLTVYYSEAQNADTMVRLADKDGNTIVAFTPQKEYSSAIMSSPALTVGETYTLYAGDAKLADITLTDMLTNVNSDGSAYEGRQGGFGPGGQMPEGMELPEGMEPPEGMERPAGGERPQGGGPGGRGGQMPEGMTPPEGMEPPAGGEPPQQPA